MSRLRLLDDKILIEKIPEYSSQQDALSPDSPQIK